MSVPAGEMDDECECGHTLRKHPIYLWCEADGCSCAAWALATVTPWYAEVVATCICGTPVRRNEPRKAVDFNDRENVTCHLSCAPAPPMVRSPFTRRLRAA